MGQHLQLVMHAYAIERKRQSGAESVIHIAHMQMLEYALLQVLRSSSGKLVKAQDSDPGKQTAPSCKMHPKIWYAG